MDWKYLALILTDYAIQKSDGDPVTTFSSKPQ